MPKSKRTQQVVIPKGTLGPGEAAVIEIPRRYHRDPVVIIKRRPGDIAKVRADGHFVPGPDLPQVGGGCFSPMNHPGPATPQMSTPYTMQGPSYSPPQPMMVPNMQQCGPQIPMQSVPVLLQPQAQPSGVTPQYAFCPNMPVNYLQPAPAMYPDQYHAPRGNRSSKRHSPQIDLHRREKMERDILRRSLDDFHISRRKFVTSGDTLVRKVSTISNSSRITSRSLDSDLSDSSTDSYDSFHHHR